MEDITARELGAVVDHRTREYVRWTKEEDQPEPFFAVQDCYRYIGIARVDVPKGPSIKSKVRGARTCTFWRENRAHGGRQVILGVPAIYIRYLNTALSTELALSVAGGVERLCYFLLRNSPELLLEACFVSPQKSDRQR
ncbi:hypothetical protein M3P21_20995 [Ruegeria sp. 2012CJ41-6]|uniref:Uncharacterized protein n=1 Tax=Ruegeria spongiae TaxID=2942209 RepID=A0ABT0Q7Z0_9RHOB|nr:hypothetical protein [Ruegeria spongiae]MCL6285996.1 hypothetical protein [Ruegeria spongiae]